MIAQPTADATPPQLAVAVSQADASTLAPGARRLPAAVRRDVFLLYGLLRTLDDLVDGQADEADERLSAVERWIEREDVSSRESAAFEDLWSRHELSLSPLRDFCSAMRDDLERRPIENEQELESYCQRAGGSIGLMLADMIGTASSGGRERMACLGRAAQRTNILRDIDEDSEQGRLYIPSSAVARYGPPAPGKRERLLRDQISRADALYDSALTGPPILGRGNEALTISVALYREILRQIEREGYGRQAGRVAVPAWRQRLVIARARVRFNREVVLHRAGQRG